MLPTFIVIGAMKSGTTSLYHYLRAHPEICMSSIKETNYFIEEKNYSRGLEWYKSLFPCNSEKMIGEASTSYTKRHLFGDVPQKMYAVLPNIKLIFLARDPIRRMLSHYIHNYSHGREWNNFSKAIRGRNNHYILTSKYFYQLEAFREFYPDEQIKIIKSIKLKEEREQTMKDIFRFLGVDADYVDESFYETHNTVQSKKRRRSLYTRYLKRVDLFNMEPYLPSFLTTAREFQIPTIKPEDEAYIAGQLEEDILNFSKISDEDFSDWLH